jgi:hypothetical protein
MCQGVSEAFPRGAEDAPPVTIAVLPFSPETSKSTSQLMGPSYLYEGMIERLMIRSR